MKCFRKFVTIWRVALLEAKIMIFSWKFLILSVMSWMFMDYFTRLVREFALAYGQKIVPAQLPFYFADGIQSSIAFLLLIFLFNDIPLKDPSQRQILQRSGIRSFGAGQLLALVLVAMVYVAEQFIFSVLACLPCVEFGGWGKIWQSVAERLPQELGYEMNISVSQKILANYQPWQAIAASAVLFCLTGVCYGMVQYLLNGISNGNLGTVVLTTWNLAWLVIQSVLGKWKWMQVALRFSPANWNDLSYRDVSGIVQVGVRILLCIVVLAAVNQLLLRQRTIEVA